MISVRISEIRVVKKFSSGHAPSLLNLTFANGAKDAMVYKKDDLRYSKTWGFFLLRPQKLHTRTDLMACSLFGLFNALWRIGRVRASAKEFGVFPLTREVGLMSFVGDSIPLREWDPEALLKASPESLLEFIGTAAGSWVSCYILGIRDRHRDNIMIQQVSECQFALWQLDFKHVWNWTTGGVDAPILCVPRALKRVLLQLGVWFIFKQRIASAFRCLRRNYSVIMQSARSLFRGISDDLAIQNCISNAFFIAKDEDAAVTSFLLDLDMSVYSFKKYLKNTFHQRNISSMNNNNNNNN